MVNLFLGSSYVVDHKAEFDRQRLIVQEHIRCRRVPVAGLANTARIHDVAVGGIQGRGERGGLRMTDDPLRRALPDHRQVGMADKAGVDFRRVALHMRKAFLEMPGLKEVFIGVPGRTMGGQPTPPKHRRRGEATEVLPLFERELLPGPVHRFPANSLKSWYGRTPLAA